jgi:hypothetical protein
MLRKVSSPDDWRCVTLNRYPIIALIILRVSRQQQKEFAVRLNRRHAFCDCAAGDLLMPSAGFSNRCESFL